MKISFFTIFATIILATLLAAVGGYYFLIYQPQNAQQDENFDSFSSSKLSVDDRPLKVEVIKPKRTVKNPFTEVTVIANKEIRFEQHNRLDSSYIGEEDGQHYYIVSVDNVPQVGVKATIKIFDAVGNKFSKKINISRDPISLPAGLSAITPWPESDYILDGSKLDVKVTKSQRLREDYVPTDLVDLNKEFGILTLNNASLRADAARALDSMIKDLIRETGVKDLTVVSGYRSYETQVETYAYWVRTVGVKQANKISARPGHSEHQLGTTVDFSTVGLDYSLSEEFAETAVGRWLAENAANYGFQQFNDPDYAPEPWQFRWYGWEE